MVATKNALWVRSQDPVHEISEAPRAVGPEMFPQNQRHQVEGFHHQQKVNLIANMTSIKAMQMVR